MRLIQNMSTIAESTEADQNPDQNRVIKIAVIGGSGVGKTGKNTSLHLEDNRGSIRD